VRDRPTIREADDDPDAAAVHERRDPGSRTSLGRHYVEGDADAEHQRLRARGNDSAQLPQSMRPVEPLVRQLGWLVPFTLVIEAIFLAP
jgi:hypothetical protein